MKCLEFEKVRYHKLKLFLLFLLTFFVSSFIVENQAIFSAVYTDVFSAVTPPNIVYRNNTKIPKAPKGRLWPEEAYLYERDVADLKELADPLFSTIVLEGKPEVRLGDTVHVTVTLYDGNRRRKKQGGDLVRVWMREKARGASSNGKVIDNNDGSYTAILTTFLEGQPEVVAAIISPREVIAFTMKRRYILPQVFMNTAIFEHPVEKSIVEETPCNYDPQIPGYGVTCNFTMDNYGVPWYCGKPRTFRLSCSDWSMIGSANLWKLGIEQRHLSPFELDLLSPKRKAMVLTQKLIISVGNESSHEILESKSHCNSTSRSLTWRNSSPTGYLYNQTWNSKYCRREPRFNEAYKSCLMNTTVLAIGDSTIRQIFLGFKSMAPCSYVTETWSLKGKHRPVTCISSEWNFTLTYALHQLPICFKNTPRTYPKPLRAYSSAISKHKRTIIVINLYAHLLNHHSHVYIEHLRRLKRDIIDILQINPNITVIIKGPHAYSFAKNTDAVLWMPDIYVNIYQDYLYEIFQGLDDRVIYINTLDMTVSSEQWHVHSEEYIIREQCGPENVTLHRREFRSAFMVYTFLRKVCPLTGTNIELSEQPQKRPGTGISPIIVDALYFQARNISGGNIVYIECAIFKCSVENDPGCINSCNATSNNLAPPSAVDTNFRFWTNFIAQECPVGNTALSPLTGFVFQSSTNGVYTIQSGPIIPTVSSYRRYRVSCDTGVCTRAGHNFCVNQRCSQQNNDLGGAQKIGYQGLEFLISVYNTTSQPVVSIEVEDSDGRTVGPQQTVIARTPLDLSVTVTPTPEQFPNIKGIFLYNAYATNNPADIGTDRASLFIDENGCRVADSPYARPFTRNCEDFVLTAIQNATVTYSNGFCYEENDPKCLDESYDVQFGLKYSSSCVR